jgi:hypothetical protein
MEGVFSSEGEKENSLRAQKPQTEVLLAWMFDVHCVNGTLQALR